MDKKVIIGIIVAIVAIALVGFYIISTAEVTLIAEDAQITLPGNYTANGDFAASAGDVNISIVEQKGSTDKDFVAQFFKAISANGKDAGYENVTNKTINEYTVYEFAAHPDKLQNVSSDKEATADGGEMWTTYPPEFAAPFDGGVDHFRTVYYVNGDKTYTLQITAANATTNLYTPEIDAIINSIAPVKK